MEYKIVRSQDYLEHHGILGQKWGVRRFQNSDGSLTPEGRERYGIEAKRSAGGKRYSVSGEVPQNGKTRKKLTPQQKKKLAIAATAAVLTVAGVALYKNKDTLLSDLAFNASLKPNVQKSVVNNLSDQLKPAIFSSNKFKRNLARKYDGSYLKREVERLKYSVPLLKAEIEDSIKLDPEIAKKIEDRGKTAVKNLSQKIMSAGDKAADAALAALGTVAITKVVDKFADKPDSTEKEKIVNKVIRESASSGINDFTKGNPSNQSNNNGQSSAPKMSEPPSKKYIDRNSPEWGSLLRDKDSKTKDELRALAKAGYDMDQIKRYLNNSYTSGTKKSNTKQNTMNEFMNRELDDIVGKEKADKIRDALEDDPNDKRANEELKRAYEFAAQFDSD